MDWNMFESDYTVQKMLLHILIIMILFKFNITENVERNTSLRVYVKISYCSKECGVQYWPYHKKLCKALQEIASEVD